MHGSLGCLFVLVIIEKEKGVHAFDLMLGLSLLLYVNYMSKWEWEWLELTELV